MMKRLFAVALLAVCGMANAADPPVRANVVIQQSAFDVAQQRRVTWNQQGAEINAVVRFDEQGGGGTLNLVVLRKYAESIKRPFDEEAALERFREVQEALFNMPAKVDAFQISAPRDFFDRLQETDPLVTGLFFEDGSGDPGAFPFLPQFFK